MVRVFGSGALAPVGRGARLGAGAISALFVAALAVRLAVFWLNARHAAPIFSLGDTTSYVGSAEFLLHGLHAPNGNPYPPWLRTPGLPALLALLFAGGIASPDHLAGAVVVTLVISALTVVLTALLADRIAGPRAGLLAGGMMAIEPSSVAYSNLIMSETLFTLVLLAALLAWRRWWGSPGIGPLAILAGLTSILPLIRPTALYMPLVIAPLMVATGPPRTRRWLAAALFLALSLAPSTLWILRNFRGTEIAEMDLRAARGKMVFARSVEDLAGVPHPSAMGNSRPPDEAFGSDGQRLPRVEISRRQNRYFSETLRAHPGATLARLALNAVEFLGSPDSKLPSMVRARVPDAGRGSVPARLRWLVELRLLGAWLLLGMAISLAGLLVMPWAWARSRGRDAAAKSLLALVMLTVLYQIGLSAFVGKQTERYRVPVIPLFATMLAVAWCGGRDARPTPPKGVSQGAPTDAPPSLRGNT